MSRRRVMAPWRIVALLVLGNLNALAQSDTAETPPDAGSDQAVQSSSSSIPPATNAASSSFLESHPSLMQAPPQDSPLSLQSGNPAGKSAGENSSGIETAEPLEHFTFPDGNPDDLPAHLLVVYNSRDPDSKSLADYYASRRNIPAERVLGIDCTTQEEITRDQYENTIREPIISYIYDKNWMERRSVSVRIGGRMMDLLLATRNEVWAMVLMRGVPLRIANDPSVEGNLEDVHALQTNAAAVDSELSLLPVFGLPLGGFVPNVFFDRTGSGLIRCGSELATKLILVTRLDGPRPADVRRMIDDSLYAEENRLAGRAVIDTRGLTDRKDPYTMGDDWLRRSQKFLARDGWTVDLDSHAEVLPPSYPCNHVALYLGWYHEGAVGPWVTPPNRFTRGAIAYHLHSFSATTVRSATDAWVGPLIAHGAAATMGCVYEPILDLTPHLDIFTSHLLAGNYFAEAAYSSLRGLSWMVTVVGDPLYRPFRKSVDSALAGMDGSAASDHYDWLLLQQVRKAINAGKIPYNVESLQHYLDVPGAVAQEGLGDLLSKLNEPSAADMAERAYRQAETLDVQAIDHIRVGLKLAQLERNRGDENKGDVELVSLRELYPVEATRFGVPETTAAATDINSPDLAVKNSSPRVDLTSPPKPPGPPRPPSP
jgi:uncharacterized protein (TIGR03790 family)